MNVLSLLLSALVLPLAGCGGVPLRDHAPVSLPADLATRGESIYIGSTWPLVGNAKEPLFVYERRVEDLGDHLVATHITRNPDGTVALADRATQTSDYQLLDYALLTDQQGQTGSIHRDGDALTFTFGEHSRVEEGAGDIVIGPTVVGYIWKRLDSLRTGETLTVRFAVLDRLETLGFALAAVPAPAGQTRVQMTPTSFVIGLVVDPVFFTFDSGSNKLVRIEGRVPPKQVKDGTLVDLDARVEYRFVAANWR